MADGLHLLPKHRRVLEVLLRKHLPDVEVWAYGSRVNGRSHDGSDLDLVLRAPDLSEISTGQLGEFGEAVRESNIPFLVETRDWARLPERFHHEIEREHVVFVENTAGRATVDRHEKSSHGSEWRKSFLRDLLSFANGKSSPTRSDALSHPVYGSNGVIGFSNHANADPNTIVIGRVGTYCGSLHYSDRMCWVTDNAIQANAINGNDAGFLFYLLQTLRLNDRRAGSGQPLLNQTILSSIPVVVPDPTEQRVIAHILGTLDDKIELNRRMNETLEAMARALFKSWFVDFDPVRAKMEGRNPDLPKDVADLFPNRLVDSLLGKIPEGWELKALDEIAGFQNGLALQKHRPEEGREWLPVVKIAQLRAGKADHKERAAANIPPQCIIDNGDVVFSWSGSLMLKLWCGGRAALNQHLFKVTSTEYPKWFFLYCLQSHLADFQAIAADKATTMGHIKRHHLGEAMCAIPNDQLLSRVDGVMTSLLEARISVNIESQTLSQLRDTILPKLISGVVRVNSAPKH